MLAMVARSGRQRFRAGAVELDELADDLRLAQQFGDEQHEVGGGDAGGEFAGEINADDFRDEEGDRLAEHAGLRLDAAHAPADDAEAVDHGGVRVGADEGVRIKTPSFSSTPLARYSRFTWWTMPMPGGTTLKVSKACSPHLRNS
jgi:hypothetical protein